MVGGLVGVLVGELLLALGQQGLDGLAAQAADRLVVGVEGGEKLQVLGEVVARRLGITTCPESQLGARDDHGRVPGRRRRRRERLGLRDLVVDLCDRLLPGGLLHLVDRALAAEDLRVEQHHGRDRHAAEHQPDPGVGLRRRRRLLVVGRALGWARHRRGLAAVDGRRAAGQRAHVAGMRHAGVRVAGDRAAHRRARGALGRRRDREVGGQIVLVTQADARERGRDGALDRTRLGVERTHELHLEHAHRLRAVLGAAREAGRDDVGQALGRVRGDVGDPGRVACTLLDQHIDRVAALERQAPGQHLEQHRAERVDVGGRVGLGARGLLGCHVVGRADDELLRRAGHRRLVVDVRADAEVDDLDEVEVAVLGHEHDVAGLEVAVNDPRLVGRAERARDLAGDVHGASGGDPALLLDHRGEVLTIEQLGDRVDAAVVELADVEHLGDVRVLELLRRLGVADEAGHHVGLARVDLGQHTQRAGHPLLGVTGPIQGAHAIEGLQVLDAVASSDHRAPALLRVRA